MIEARSNGKTAIIITPETPIQKLAAEELAAGAAKGQRISLVQNKEGQLILSLES